MAKLSVARSSAQRISEASVRACARSAIDAAYRIDGQRIFPNDHQRPLSELRTGVDSESGVAAWVVTIRPEVGITPEGPIGKRRDLDIATP